MQQGVADQGTHCQSHEELDEMIVEDFPHDGHDSHAEQAHQTDHDNGEITEAPNCEKIKQSHLKIIQVIVGYHIDRYGYKFGTCIRLEFRKTGHS